MSSLGGVERRLGRGLYRGQEGAGELASIQTAGDIYAGWDIDQLAMTLADVLTDEAE